MSVVTAQSSVGVTVCTALCTAEGRGWPVCLGLRRSAGSFSLCLLHQDVFTRGKTLSYPLSPGTPVACKRFPSVHVDGQCLQVTLSDVLETQLGSPSRLLSSCELSVEKVLGDRPSSIQETLASQTEYRACHLPPLQILRFLLHPKVTQAMGLHLF